MPRAGMLLCWDFDSVAAGDNAGAHVSDRSGNGHDGLLMAAVDEQGKLPSRTPFVPGPECNERHAHTGGRGAR